MIEIILLFIIIIILIVFSFIGILGGKWLWKELGTSNIFKDGVPIYVKIIGCVGFVILVCFTAVGFFIFYNGGESLIQQIIEQGTLLMLYIAFYNIGYIISIWKPIEEKELPEQGILKIKMKLGLTVIAITIIYTLLCFFVFFQITGDLFSNLFIYFALSGVGMAIGWLFWEHLKESNILSGKFLRDLKIFSILFEIPVIILTILGIISINLRIYYLNPFILLAYLLLLYLMAAYFLGLLIEIIKK